MRVKNKIKEVEFMLLDPERIKEQAAVKIVTPELYDADGYPVEGGLMDPRMGVISPGLRCRTCGSRIKQCPGHFGYLELARPVTHAMYSKLIYNFLRGTCRECGKIMLTDEEKKQFEEEFKQWELRSEDLDKWRIVRNVVKKAKRKDKCPHCGAEKEDISLDKPTDFKYGDRDLTPIDIKNWLEKTREEDYKFLGLDPEAGKPEWLIITTLPVPPVTMRPSITLGSGEKSEDDLTHKLGDIVRTNRRLLENLNAGAPEIIIGDLWGLLQYHVTTFFRNDMSQLPPARHRSGRPLKTLAERIKGKQGRFRRNLAGKRVNFSARSVITPGPRLDVDEVGVPRKAAKDMTIPVRVTEWNIDRLKGTVRHGGEYPGAEYVITNDGKRKRVTEEVKETLAEELEVGDKVERHMIDGDIAIFNRQPSLHRMSMMGHRVKVLPNKTFRLCLATTTPYNADFDGDEMNLHVPRTREAQAECRYLMDVNSNLQSPRYGKPIVGCKQDHIVGCYLLTREVSFNKKKTYDILSSVGLENVELPKPGAEEQGEPRWTGKQIFSFLLPDDFDFKGKTKQDDKIIIKNGELVEGYIDEQIIGGERGTLIQEILKQYGVQRASKFINQVSMMGIKALTIRGLSIYPTDTDLPEKVRKEVWETIDEAEKDVKGLIEKYRDGEITPFPGRTVRETLEDKILNRLSQARRKCGDLVIEHTGKSPTKAMALSGARGGLINLTQIAGIVGQQDLRGSRVRRGYKNRALPHFKEGNLMPRAHGFVRHGLKEGVSPFEYFFYAITGRAGLMDKSMGTPRSGYLQRRLINSLQDLKITYGGQVKDGYGRIVQYQFGEDGIDVKKSDNGTVNIKRIKDEVLEKLDEA